MGRAPSIVQQSHKSDWYSFSYSVCHCLKVATGACHLFLSATLLTTPLIALAGRPATVSARSLKCSALGKFGSEFGRCPTVIIQICDITLSMNMAVFCWNYRVVDLHECKFCDEAIFHLFIFFLQHATRSTCVFLLLSK